MGVSRQLVERGIMIGQNYKTFRDRSALSDETVDMKVVKAVLAEPDPDAIARKNWLHNLTEDEAMIVFYMLDPCVCEGSRQSAALDRHRKLLPLWRRLIHPEQVEAIDLTEISPAARLVLDRLQVLRTDDTNPRN
jgi:hypothetical protein